MFLPTISVFLAAALGWITTAPVVLAATVPPAGSLQQPQPARRAVGPVATVVAGTGDVAAADVAAVRAEVAIALPPLLDTFANRPREPFFVHVHADRQSLPAALAEHLHPDSPAFALLGAHQIHIVLGELRRTTSTLASVVRHELVHELLDQYVAPHGRLVPRWFHEGLAQHLAGDTYLQASEDDLVLRITTRRLRPFGDLRTHFPRDTVELRTAYGQSYSYVSWLVHRYGVSELLAVARATDELTSFEGALSGRLRRPTVELEADWQSYVLHGSGAPWRLLLDQCFSLSLLAVLPLLVIALIRRLDREQRAARRLAAAEPAAVVVAAPAGPPPAAWPRDAPDDAIPSEDDDAAAERREAGGPGTDGEQRARGVQ